MDVRGWVEARRLQRDQNCPGHSFTGEGFDVAAGVADGQDAVAAEVFAMASEEAVPRNFISRKSSGWGGCRN